MKQKLSITVDEGLIKIIEDMLKDGLFRNKSHIIEYAVSQWLKKGDKYNVGK